MMKRLFSTAAITAVALALAACGSGDEPASNAGEDMNAMAADPNNPFAAAELQMNETMMAAVGTDVGDSWAKKMIAHHEGAIEMSQIALQQNLKPDVAEMAKMTIEKQRQEIEEIRKLLKQGTPNQQSADLYRPAMTQMHDRMMAAKGVDLSETFMRKMLEHHRGGVSVSDIALQNGVGGALRRQVQKTRDGQQKDAAMIEAMLGGQSHQEAMAASGAKSAAEEKAEPAPAATPRKSSATAPKPPPPPTPKPAPPPPKPADPDPHAGHDMNTM